MLGSVTGGGPLLLRAALPRKLGFQGLVVPEVAAVAMVSIPASFAYSLLRHQVLGLDVLVRRVLLRISNALVGVLLFLACWVVLQAVGLPSTEAALVSAIVAGLAMPSVQTWAAARVDAWLYQPLYSLRSPGEALQSDNLDNLGVAVAVRLREVLPVQWAACAVHDDTPPTAQASPRLLGADGQLPAWLAPSPTPDPDPTAV